MTDRRRAHAVIPLTSHQRSCQGASDVSDPVERQHSVSSICLCRLGLRSSVQMSHLPSSYGRPCRVPGFIYPWKINFELFQGGAVTLPVYRSKSSGYLNVLLLLLLLFLCSLKHCENSVCIHLTLGSLPLRNKSCPSSFSGGL